MFADATADDIASQMDWLAPHFYDPGANAIVTTVQAFLIRTRGKVIVVDTCSGDCKERKGPHFHQQNRNWLGKLLALGVLPEQVDYVICTHLHVDHVGWNTRLQDELEYWRGAAGVKAKQWTGDYMTDSVEPIMQAGLADFVRMDLRVVPGGASVTRRRPYAGAGVRRHPRIGKAARSGCRSAPQSAAMRLPEWSSRFCADPRASARTRIRLLSEWADNGTLFLPAHFPAPSAGVIESKRGGFSFRFAN